MSRIVLLRGTERATLRLVCSDRPDLPEQTGQEPVQTLTIPISGRDVIPSSRLDLVAKVTPGRLLAVLLAPALIHVLFLPVSVSHDLWDWNMAVAATVSYLPLLARILLSAALKPRPGMEMLDPLIVVVFPFTSFFFFYTAVRLYETAAFFH
jgi:hypothetical protein